MLTLFALFPPDFLLKFAVFNVAQNIIKIGVFLTVLAIYISDISVHMKEKYNYFLLLFWAGIVFSSIIGNVSSIYESIGTITTTLIVCLFVEEVILYAPYKGLRYMYWYFSWLVIINTILVFVFPNALYPTEFGLNICWLLGDDNTAYTCYMFASTLCMVYSRCIVKKTTILSVMVWILSFVYVFQRDIATGVFCQIIWGIIFLIYHVGGIKKLIRANYAVYIIIGGLFLLVITRRIILEPIVAMLGRSVTLTGRTIVWDSVLKMIEQKPVLGYGIIDQKQFNSLLNIPILGIHSAHNLLLELLVWGGIVAAVFFLLMVYFACRKGKSYRSTDYYRCLSIGIIVFCIRFLVEDGNSNLLYACLTLLAYTEEFLQRSRSFQLSREIKFRLSHE